MTVFLRIFGGLLTLLLSFISVAQAGTYVDNKDGTIFDTRSNLMWQQRDDGTERVWEAAVKYCDDLELAGQSDWTLPKIFMLEGVLDSGQSPTIDPIFSVKPSYYWSSTESRTTKQSAKYVNFFYGNTYTYSKDNTYYALCVRDASGDRATPLSADFTFNEGAQQTAIQFSSVISGGMEPYFREWDFGDGDTSSLSAPTHEFAGDGSYRIILTVSDNDGSIAVAQKNISLPLPETTPASDSALIGDERRGGESNVEEVMREDNTPDLVGSVSEEDVITDGGSLNAAAMPQENDLAEFDAASQALANQEEGGLPEAAEQVTGQEETKVGDETKLAPPSKEMAEASAEVADETKETGSQPLQQSVLQVRAKVKQGEAAVMPGAGILAYSFANALHGDADVNKDSEVVASELQGYLKLAIGMLSDGRQTPDISFVGDSFSVCSEAAETYAFVIGGNTFQHGGEALPFAAESAELVRKSVEQNCRKVKTISLSGEHASRQGVLQALLQIKSLIQPADTLVFYFAGKSISSPAGRLIFLLYDSDESMSSLTGLYYADITNFIATMNVAHTILLVESLDSQQ